jgi:hypothetical protein
MKNVILNAEGYRESSADIFTQDGLVYVNGQCVGSAEDTGRTTLPEGWPIYRFSEVAFEVAVKGGLNA